MKEKRQKVADGTAHKRLSDDLRAAIKERRFGVEGRVPTEAELARTYRVSRHTVRRALQDLVSEGVVYRVQGRGTFATALSGHGHYVRSVGSLEDLLAWTGARFELVEPMRLTKDAEAATRLQLSSSAVASLTMLRLYEAKVFGVTRVCLSPELGQRLIEAGSMPEKGSGTVVSRLEELIPRKIAGVIQDMDAVGAPSGIAGLIDCRPGEAILRAERTFFDSDDKIVEWSITHYHPQRYRHHLELRGKVR